MKMLFMTLILTLMVMSSDSFLKCAYCHPGRGEMCSYDFQSCIAANACITYELKIEPCRPASSEQLCKFVGATIPKLDATQTLFETSE
ncbi:hypothetical protein Q7C36_000272 [Tachysurus vachellii]|uniref:UPAR/Ly6 domain-containing protein n=1 Tax=Tachysurus vachellii TaxID=175792 RepID=A0AA88TIK9_TACVA|nr:hypothetical protein Q7C36_000272 [Tachysurus vachellii]